MTVEIRLFATLRKFLPPGSNMFSFKKSLKKRTTVGEIISELGLPQDVPKIIMVNGTHATPEYLLADGDALSLYPPVTGG